MPELLEDDDPEEGVEETETEVETEEEEPMPETPNEDGEVESEEETEEVAEVEMPGEADEVDGGIEDEESSGALGRINTKAIIVAATIVVGVLIVLRYLRSGSGAQPQRRGRAGQEQEEGNPERRDGDGGERLEDQITAPDSQPLKQDDQMMSALGLGEGR